MCKLFQQYYRIKYRNNLLYKQKSYQEKEEY